MRALIVGSGAAAAGAALALTSRPDVDVTVVDIGAELEAANRASAARLSRLPAPELASAGTADLGFLAPSPARGELPEKRLFGSSFPFADHGQLTGVEALGRANPKAVSGAYGGFSNVWGAQMMPFSSSSFRDWPVRASEMAPHYRAICDHVPVAGEHDDLAEIFPYAAAPQPLPLLAPRTVMVMGNYSRHRASLRRRGVIAGHSRLAMRPGACVRCGLCMTGCPHSLIYSASQTFDELRRRGRVHYRSGLLAYRVRETGGVPYVLALEADSGRSVELSADRIYLACGALGTTRLVLGSLGAVGHEVPLVESAQFIFPALSKRPAPDPTKLHGFTLGQFNVVVGYGPDGAFDSSQVAQVQFYPYNTAVAAALPGLLQLKSFCSLRTALLSRLTIGLGYLPSSASRKLAVKVPSPPAGRLAPLQFYESGPADESGALGPVLRKLLSAAHMLDLWPVLPQVRMARPGMGYHFGGSFPHRPGNARVSRFTTDRTGRLPEWRRVHLVDGAVFPTVPATTFVMTLMANAHRIAGESLDLSED
ncbi:MAG TPA: hypothetical protein VL984_13035 [Acidimicrobiales bacterium]|nr:hypothetical protein [Acidimicrobiales bacterium]